MTNRYVYALADAPAEAALVGGKALGLGRLLRANATVPPGFVLTAEAFRLYLRENRLDGELAELASGQGADEQALALLRAARWPEELRSALAEAYRSLCEAPGNVPVAVRSSATAEDSATASFAGQHATLLNVDGEEAMFDAILACWASLYGATALYYRRSKGVADESPAMAVVVQALVQSEAAGVGFTLDPVDGDRDVALIEGAWGLGEGVVSGIVTPDHFMVHKKDGTIVRREISKKKLRVVSDEAGGTRTEELPPELASHPVLTDAQAIELAQTAARIEADAGCPQDIEWALANGTFYILQARPITAAAGFVPEPIASAPLPAQPVDPPPGSAAGELDEWVSEFDTDTAPDTVWTSANVQEVLPDQLSPLNSSMTMDIIQRFGTEPVRKMGIKLKTKEPFSGMFYGKAFLNVSMMMDIADQTPFGSIESLMEQFFGQGREQYDPLLPKKTLSFRRLGRYIVVLPRMLWFTMRMPNDVHRAEKIIARFDREAAARPFQALSDEELIAAAKEGLGPGGDVGVIHISGGGLTSTNFEMLRGCTEAWLGDKNGVLQSKLCTGLAAVESAQPAYELWDLSRMVLASEQLPMAFESKDGHEIAGRVADLHGADIDTFLRRLDAFLSRHGHRSVMEAEPSAKSWEEDLPTVFVMVRNYLRASESADPLQIEERQRHEREKATRDSMRRLSFWKRPLFRYVLAQAQKWVRMREHTKSLMMRATDRGRKLTREMGRRLVERGLLDDVFDLYDLTWDEVQALLRGTLSRDEAYARIVRRRAEGKRNEGVVLPEAFRGRPKPLRPEERPLPEDHVLRGIAVSPGRITGRARVIMDPRVDGTIEPGEILVAPVTDAGWTPLFVAAVGVVVDVGGSLSHGSTVAREYGLPAVVNVKHGTRMIRTGQLITVDGTLGIVILEDGSETREA
jgi:phosphohistidine swiveling domain-containing protein